MFKVIFLVLVLSTSALAAEPFSLRFTSALDRFPNSADTAALSASVGSARGASVNPAAIGWNKFKGHAITPTYSFLDFNNGTHLEVATATYTRGLGNNGNLQFTFTKVISNEEMMANSPLLYDYKMNYYKTQWGYHVSDDLAIGVNLNYSNSETNNSIPNVGAKYLKSESETFGTAIGAIYRLTPKMLMGLTLDYSESPSTTDIYKYNLTQNDTVRKLSTKAGMSYRIIPSTYVNFDLQYGSFKNNKDKFEVGRASLGVEHTLVEYLVFKAGTVFDADGNKSVTGGLRLYPSKKVNIDMGYQYNMYPEVKPEFGTSSLYTISLGVML
jgi:hypothetical protein